MSKHRHPQRFLTDFLNAVPDVPEREELRKLRVHRFIAIDELQFYTTYVRELAALLGQLEELALTLDNLEETLLACRTARANRVSGASTVGESSVRSRTTGGILHHTAALRGKRNAH